MTKIAAEKVKKWWYISTGESLFKYSKRIVRLTISEFNQDRCMREANAMAYRTLLSLVPMFAIFLWVFTAFGVFENQREKVIDTIYHYFVPSASEVVKENILSMASNAKALGTFGVLGLFLAAVYLFNAIEATFNRIWNIPHNRPLFARLTSFTNIMVWTPVLIGASFYFTAKVQGFLRVDDLMGIGFINKASLTLFPVIFMWAALTILLIMVPNTRVSLRPALVGGIVASILVEIIKVAADWYLARVVTYNVLYGSLGAIPMVLVSVYLTWLAILLGVEVTFAIQCYHFNVDNKGEGVVRSRTLLTLGIMLDITSKFIKAKEAPDVPKLTRKFKASLPEVNNIIGRLKERALITASGPAIREHFLPAHDPCNISMLDVFEAAGELPVGVKDLSLNSGWASEALNESEQVNMLKIFKSLEDFQMETLGNISMEDFVREIDKTSNDLTKDSVK